MGRDFQRVLRFGGKQDQVKLVSLSVVLNCGNVDNVCPHLSSDAGRSQARSAQLLRGIGIASRKPDGQSCADGTCRNCSAQRTDAHYQYLHAPAHGSICREKPVLAGRVTCGVRSETTGQSWPSKLLLRSAHRPRLPARKPGPVKLLLPRELGALDGPVLNDVSFEGSAIIRPGEVDTPIARGHTRYGTDEMDFDPVCVDDRRTVICRAQV